MFHNLNNLQDQLGSLSRPDVYTSGRVNHQLMEACDDQ